jgi:hypothetical protein
MSNAITATYVSQITTNETVADGPNESQVIQHAGLNTAQVFNSASTPKGQAVAPFTVTLSGGAATVDLTAVPASSAPTQAGNTPAGATINGSTCGAGATATAVQTLKIVAPATNANPITVAPGASNGYKATAGGFIFVTGKIITLQPGDEVLFKGAAPAISSTVKTLDLAGTGSSDVLQFEIILG